MRKILIGAAMLGCIAAVPASAATFVVDAQGNSSSGGVGLASLTVAAGEKIKVSSSTDDLWSAGALPRFSDANGLTGDRFASAADDSGQSVGTQIGQDFGLWGQHGITAPFGSLVGEIGGNFFLIGANNSFVAPTAGVLNLYYWDSNNGDNTGAISFNVTAVPEPAAWAMMLGGFGLAGYALRRRRASVRVTYA